MWPFGFNTLFHRFQSCRGQGDMKVTDGNPNFYQSGTYYVVKQEAEHGRDEYIWIRVQCDENGSGTG